MKQAVLFLSRQTFPERTELHPRTSDLSMNLRNKIYLFFSHGQQLYGFKSEGRKKTALCNRNSEGSGSAATRKRRNCGARRGRECLQPRINTASQYPAMVMKSSTVSGITPSVPDSPSFDLKPTRAVQRFIFLASFLASVLLNLLDSFLYGSRIQFTNRRPYLLSF